MIAVFPDFISALPKQLRSAGAAHVKGTNYADALKRGGLDGISLVEASMKVFEGAARFAEWLQTKVLNIEEDKPPPMPLE